MFTRAIYMQFVVYCHSADILRSGYILYIYFNMGLFIFGGSKLKCLLGADVQCTSKKHIHIVE